MTRWPSPDPNDEGGYLCLGCSQVYTAQTVVDLGRRLPPLLTHGSARTSFGAAPIRIWKNRDLVKPVNRDTRLVTARRVRETAREIGPQCDMALGDKLVPEARTRSPRSPVRGPWASG